MRGRGLAALALVGLSLVLSSGGPSSASSRSPSRTAGLPEGLLNNDVVVMNADGSDQRNVTRSVVDELDPVPSPDGAKIAYYKSAEVFVMDVDGSDKRNLTRNRAFDCCPVWSPDGRLIAFYGVRGGVRAESDILVVTADGRNLRNLTRTPTTFDSSPVWSPDGTRIALVSSGLEDHPDIYVMNVDGGERRNLTRNPAVDWYPVWSPDGTKIAFQSRGRSEHGSTDIVVMNADGSNQTDLTPDWYPQARPAWSPDGSKIVFQGYGTLGNNDIYVMNADGSGKENLTPETPYRGEGSPAWSPNGRQIAYGTHRWGPSLRYGRRRLNREVFVMNADGSNKRNLTEDRSFDDFPRWSADGRKIIFTRRSPICRVPYVVSRRLAVAREQVKGSYCTIGRTRYRASSRKRGLVLEMTPRPGRLLFYRSRVDLVVSSGGRLRRGR